MSSGSSSIGTFNHGYDVSKLPKTDKEGYPIMAINAQQPFRGKSLDELRVEDYFSYKGNKIPNQNLNIIHQQWQQNIQNRGGAQSGNMFGGNNNNNNGGGNLFGGNNNNNNNGGLFGNKNNSGGLFGGNNNNNNGGLFGGNNNNNNNKGGLFGGNNNNNGGGLFGGNNNNNGGGLFGNKNNSGGLFGGNNNNNGGGLFGGNNNNNGGGLFGGNKTGGLFGGSNTGGLFGSNNNNNNNKGGLFGGSNGGGLFGGNNNNNGGGLFGQQRQGGLFSGMNNNNGGGLFSGLNNNNNNNNNNGSSGYYNNDAQLLLEAQKLLSGIDLEQAKAFDSIRLNFGATQQNYNLFGKSVGSGAETTKEFLGRYEAEEQFTNSTKRTFKSSSYKTSSRKSSFYNGGDSDDDSQLIFKNKAHQHHHHSRLRVSNPHLLARKANSEDFIDRNSAFYDDYSEVGKRIRLNSYTEAKNVENSLDISSMYDSIRIYVFLNQEGQEKSCSLSVCYSKTCLEVKRIALEKLFDETDAQLSKYKLVYNNRILRDTTKIKDTLIKDNDKIYIIPDSESENYSYSSFSSPSKEHLASESLIPRLTKEYHTEPSMPRISRMTADELRNIENFVIFNEYVRVVFDGVTDVTGLNLDEVVQLKHRSIEIYPENGAITIPQVGSGLNKAATIEFYQWSVPKKYQNDLRSYDIKLQNWARSIGAQFVSFDSAQGVVCIRVENFNTKSQDE